MNQIAPFVEDAETLVENIIQQEIDVRANPEYLSKNSLFTLMDEIEEAVMKGIESQQAPQIQAYMGLYKKFALVIIEDKKYLLEKIRDLTLKMKYRGGFCEMGKDAAKFVNESDNERLENHQKDLGAVGMGRNEKIKFENQAFGFVAFTLENTDGTTNEEILESLAYFIKSVGTISFNYPEGEEEKILARATEIMEDYLQHREIN